MSRIATIALALTVFVSALAPSLATAAPPAAHAMKAARLMMEPMPTPAPTVAAVTRALAARRKASLAAFRAYVRAGVYPTNTYRPHLLNVWRDAAGHFCAAATMVRARGASTLADEAADHGNVPRRADATDGPLVGWVLTSGLTQAEVVDTERPFVPAPPAPHAVAAKRTAAEQEPRRLARLYKQIEARLVAAQKRSLRAAATLLVKTRPDLALALVNG